MRRTRCLRPWSFLTAAATVCASMACQGDVNVPAPPGGEVISLAMDVQPIFNARCTSCHRADSPTVTFIGIEMVLTEGAVHGALVGQPSSQLPDLTLVVPGEAEASLLWLKVSSNQPPVGATMPLFGERLTSEELALVRDWIDQGAEDN